jgi:tetratricopeptide (TPR) repeat protein
VKSAFVIAGLVAGLLPAASVARADSALRPEQIPQRARELAEKGRTYHDEGDYAHAIVAFKEAYVLAPSPGLLFNLAQAYRLSGDCDNAAWMYRRFLDTNPQPAARSLAEGHLSTVDKCRHAKLELSITPAALDARVPAPPFGDSLEVHNGPTDVHVNRKKQVGTYLVIGGGAALAVAGYFALDAHAASNDVEEAYKRGAKWKDIQSIDERGQRSSTLAGVFGVAGLAAAGTGGVLYYLGYRDEHATRRIAVMPDAHGARFSVSWKF